MNTFSASQGSQSQKSWLREALHNKGIALFLVMIVAVPLFASPADLLLRGVAALTLETFALLLLTRLLWRAKWDLRREQLHTFAVTSANIPIMLLLSWVTVSCLLSPHKIFSLQYLLQVAAGATLYFVVAYQFRRSRQLSLLVDVLVFLVLVISVSGLVQYHAQDEARASAVFGNAQPLASFEMLMLPIVAALAFGDKNANRRLVAQATLVLMVGCLLLTQGRSAWLGGAASLLILALLSRRVHRLQKGARRRTEVVGSSALPLKARKDQLVWPATLVVMTMASLFVMNSQSVNLMQRALTLLQLESDQSFQTRVQQHWHGALEMVVQRPLIGWGAGHFPLYQKPFTQIGVEISPLGTGTRVSLAEMAHNFYLQTAAELGLIGLSLMLAVLGCFWTAAWRRMPYMEAGLRRTMLMASSASLAGFSVDALGSPSWQYAQNSMFLWLVLGIGTSCLSPSPRSEVTAATLKMSSPSPYAIWATRLMAVGLFLLISMLLPTSYVAPGFHNDGKGEWGFKGAYGVAAAEMVGYAFYTVLLSSRTDLGTAGRNRIWKSSVR